MTRRFCAFDPSKHLAYDNPTRRPERRPHAHGLPEPIPRRTPRGRYPRGAAAAYQTRRDRHLRGLGRRRRSPARLSGGESRGRRCARAGRAHQKRCASQDRGARRCAAQPAGSGCTTARDEQDARRAHVRFECRRGPFGSGRRSPGVARGLTPGNGSDQGSRNMRLAPGGTRDAGHGHLERRTRTTLRQRYLSSHHGSQRQAHSKRSRLLRRGQRVDSRRLGAGRDQPQLRLCER